MLFLALARPVHAQDDRLNETKLFDRCYSHLTGLQASPRHPKRLEVLRGKPAIQACLEILRKANFTNDQVADPSDKETLAVLKHFNDFHRTWFTADDYSAALSNIVKCGEQEHDVYDSSEAALHITRALFNPSVRYDEVLKGTYVMEGLRSRGYPTLGPNTYGGRGTAAAFQKGFINGISHDLYVKCSDPTKLGCRNIASSEVVFEPPTNYFIQLGDLFGIRPILRGKSLATGAKFNFGLRLSTFRGTAPFQLAPGGTVVPYSYASPYVAADRGNASKGQSAAEPDSTVPINPYTGGIDYNGYPNRSFGSGIIGTPSHMLLNWGLFHNQRMDGGRVMARRWSKEVYSGLMCRETPLLRPSDTISYLRPTTDIPFWQSTQCLACHASLDNMAAAVRNFTVHASDSAMGESGTGSCNRNFGITAVHMAKRHTDLPEATALNNGHDANFWRRPPKGRLFYRSFDGSLIDEEITGLEGANGMGAKIAEQLDPYMCVTSRYFQLFTGIKVNLQDEGDPARPRLTGEERHYRELLKGLAMTLKNSPTQSLEDLVEAIMRLPLYSRPSLKDAL